MAITWSPFGGNQVHGVVRLSVSLSQPPIELPPVLCPSLQAELFDFIQVAQRYVATKGLQRIELFTHLVCWAFPTTLKGLVFYALDYRAGPHATIAPKPAWDLAS